MTDQEIIEKVWIKLFYNGYLTSIARDYKCYRYRVLVRYTRWLEKANCKLLIREEMERILKEIGGVD